MNTAIDQRMKSFAVSLLETGGGLIEWPEHLKSGFAILPPQTAALLECPENTEITAESVERGLTIALPFFAIYEHMRHTLEQTHPQNEC